METIPKIDLFNNRFRPPASKEGFLYRPPRVYDSSEGSAVYSSLPKKKTVSLNTAGPKIADPPKGCGPPLIDRSTLDTRGNNTTMKDRIGSASNLLQFSNVALNRDSITTKKRIDTPAMNRILDGIYDLKG